MKIVSEAFFPLNEQGRQFYKEETVGGSKITSNKKFFIQSEI
jgi:hypothetical protein